LLNKVAHWLPLLALVCFAGGILAARRRRRALMISALSAAVGMVVLGIGVLIGRQIYLNSLPLHYLTANDAGRIFDTVVRFLRDGLRIVFAVGLIIRTVPPAPRARTSFPAHAGSLLSPLTRGSQDSLRPIGGSSRSR
jgi:hypothetical protein